MNIITLKEYYLFCKYGSELLWVSDALRHERPTDTNEETDKMFHILEEIDHKTELISLNNHSKNLNDKYKSDIELLKINMTQEVYILIKSKYFTSCQFK